MPLINRVVGGGQLTSLVVSTFYRDGGFYFLQNLRPTKEEVGNAIAMHSTVSTLIAFGGRERRGGLAVEYT